MVLMWSLTMLSWQSCLDNLEPSSLSDDHNTTLKNENTSIILKFVNGNDVLYAITLLIALILSHIKPQWEISKDFKRKASFVLIPQ